MTAPGRVWRTILWIERFLPTPVPVASDAKRSARTRGRAALVPLLVYPVIVLPMLLRNRHAFGEVVTENRALFAQLTLVVAGCIAVAAIGFGLKAWRDATNA